MGNEQRKFAILFHECPAGVPRPDHWDLMLVRGGALRTWALDFMPDISATGVADALADHRLEYLTYEGPISGDRGWVTRWDEGEFEWLEDSPQVCRVRLRGQRLANVLATFSHLADQRWSVSFSLPV